MRLLYQNNASQRTRIKYAFFDGDNIGNSIKNLLSNGRVQEATHLSERIKLAIFQIELFIDANHDVEIIISGGDDVLIKFNSEKYDYSFLEEVSNIFTKHTGLSMSCGVGSDVNQAINSLRSIKQQNKGVIKSFDKDTKSQDISMKETRLYIFVTSKDPDPYINVLAHCASYYNRLQQVNLVSIIEDRGKIESRTLSLNTLKEDIHDQLSSLSSGKYLKIKDQDAKEKDKKWEQIDIPAESIEPSDCKRYENLKAIPIDVKVAIYQDLDREISKWVQTDESIDHLFDVTGVAKKYLIDVYTLLRFKNNSSIYSFEQIPEPDYTQKYLNLIHNFECGITYRYNCLAASFYTKDKFIVNEDSIVAEEDINRLRAALEILEKHGAELENKIAIDFARYWCLFYFLILLSFFVLSVHLIRQPDGWNLVEPVVFVITTGWFLLNYLLQVIFVGRVVSLDPLQLFPALKSWKEQRLKKSRSSRMNRVL